MSALLYGAGALLSGGGAAGLAAWRRIRTLRHALAWALAENAEQHYMATHDPLTGLLNRSGMAEVWPTLAGPVTLALVDLDGFKPLNDQYGHAAGDHALQVIAARLALHGVACRLGGDEFVIAAPAPRLPRWVAEAIEEPFTLPGQPQPVTLFASIGAVRVPDPAATDMGEWVGLADAAMYRAKHSTDPDRRIAWYHPGADDRAADQRPAERIRDSYNDAYEVIW